MKRVTQIRPDKIVVGERHRKDLGDLDPLMESIAKLGMLQPILCRTENERLYLVAGQRRLEACKQLKTPQVPVVTVDTLESAVKLLKAERDENQCRKPMTPTELKALTDELLEVERPAAKERQQQHADTAPGRPASESLADANTSAHVGRSVSDSADTATKKAADAAGWSRSSYQRVQEVERAMNDEALPAPVREAAAQEHSKLESGDTTPGAAATTVREAKVEHNVTKKAKAATVTDKIGTYKAMAAEGYSSRQIAKDIGVKHIGAFRDRHGLEIPPADSAIGKTRHLDPNRIVTETVASLEGLASSVRLLDGDTEALDRTRIDGWVTSLGDSLRPLNNLRKQLREMTHVEA